MHERLKMLLQCNRNSEGIDVQIRPVRLQVDDYLGEMSFELMSSLSGICQIHRQPTPVQQLSIYIFITGLA